MEPQINTDFTDSQLDDSPRFADYPNRDLTEKIIGSAFEVHKALGPGFLEKVYESALLHELRLRDVQATAQAEMKVVYKNCVVGVYYGDLLIEGMVLCEIKAAQSLAPEHIAQTLNYLKATGIKVGLLLNFGSKSLQVKRLVV